MGDGDTRQLHDSKTLTSELCNMLRGDDQYLNKFPMGICYLEDLLYLRTHIYNRHIRRDISLSSEF